MTTDEKVNVFRAWCEGKIIQTKCRGVDQEWADCSSHEPVWAFVYFEYRIKPEPPKPREWWAVPMRADAYGAMLYELMPLSTRGYADKIHVREVLP